MSSNQVVLVSALVAFGAIAGASPAPGDSPREAATEPSMHMPMGAMHGDDHMNNPLHRQIMNIFLLPEMQSELGLTAQQTAELRRLKQDLLTKSKDITAQIAAHQKDLDSILSGDTSRTRAVKALFEKMADLHAQLQYAGFETSVKMKGALNSQQRAKFDAMKPMEVHHLMMAHGNMAEIEETMQRMGVEHGMGMAEGMGMKEGMGQGSMGMHERMGMHSSGGDPKPSATPEPSHDFHDHH